MRYLSGLRSPGFAIAAVGLMVIGIAAATLTFTFTNALLLRPLPVRAPERLVRIVTVSPRIRTRSDFNWRYWDALRREAKAFSGVTATLDRSGWYADGQRTERVQWAASSTSFFETFGVAPLIGSAYSAQAPLRAVLSYQFWKRRYAGDTAVVGRVVRLQGAAFEIAGVMPEGFNGATVESGPDVRVPLEALASLFPGTGIEEWDGSFELVARLSDGVAVEAARGEAYRLYVNTSKADDKPVAARDFDLESMTNGVSRLRKQAATPAALAMAGACLLMLMVCLNLSGLLLARLNVRRRDFAVRRALGATRARLAAMILAETAAVVVAGSVPGALLAMWGARWAAERMPPVRLLDNRAVPMALDLSPDWGVFRFAVLLCFAALALVALVPAWQAGKIDANVLREGSSGNRTRGWKGLVAVQVALCTSLLFGAGAVKATLENLRTQDIGLVRDKVIGFTLDPDVPNREAGKRILQTAIAWRAAVKEMPGVAEAALCSVRLMRGSGLKTTTVPVGSLATAADFMNTSMQSVGVGYFETLGQRLVEGRMFTPAEYVGVAVGKSRAIVVNEAFAARFGLGGKVAGARFGSGRTVLVESAMEVVGVVSDAKYRSMREPMQPTTYRPLGSEAGRLTLQVRTLGPPQDVIESVRGALAKLDSKMVVEDIATLAQDIEASLWTERALLWVSNAFAALAALVAGAGLTGLLMFLVAARRREIAVRVAVGAMPRDIFALVLGEAVWPVVIGLGLGAAAGYGLLRASASALYGVSTGDPRLIALSAAGVCLVALAATVIPAQQALRVDPAGALRDV